MPQPRAKSKPHIRLPYPHTGQQYVLEHAKRFNIVLAGRRWRKTTMCMAICVAGAPNASVPIAGAATSPTPILWGSPTLDQSRVGFNETKKAAGDYAEFRQSPTMDVLFPSGGSIFFRSLDSADHARGNTAKGIVVDECQDVSEEAYSEVLRPMLIDDPESWLFLIGTPKPGTWFMALIDAVRDDPEWAIFEAPTLGVDVEEDADGTARLVRAPHPLENPNILYSEIQKIFNDPNVSLLQFMQEIMARLTKDVPGALWKQATIDALRVTEHPPLSRVVVGVDPNVSDTGNSDEMGIVVCGVDALGIGYTLADRTVRGAPDMRAGAVVNAYYDFQADAVAVEVNNGGDWIENSIHALDPSVNVKAVHASRGKLTRAEPIATRYGKKMWHHVGTFPALEFEMRTAISGKVSPNRMDALVWAATALTTGPSAHISFGSEPTPQPVNTTNAFLKRLQHGTHI